MKYTEECETIEKGRVPQTCKSGGLKNLKNSVSVNVFVFAISMMYWVLSCIVAYAC